VYIVFLVKTHMSFDGLCSRVHYIFLNLILNITSRNRLNNINQDIMTGHWLSFLRWNLIYIDRCDLKCYSLDVLLFL
jgi:hypothetical protein